MPRPACSTGSTRSRPTPPSACSASRRAPRSRCRRMRLEPERFAFAVNLSGYATPGRPARRRRTRGAHARRCSGAAAPTTTSSPQFLVEHTTLWLPEHVGPQRPRLPGPHPQRLRAGARRRPRLPREAARPTASMKPEQADRTPAAAASAIVAVDPVPSVRNPLSDRRDRAVIALIRRLPRPHPRADRRSCRFLRRASPGLADRRALAASGVSAC